MWLALCMLLMSSIITAYHVNEMEPTKLCLLLTTSVIVYCILFRQWFRQEKLNKTVVVRAGLLMATLVMMGERWSFVAATWIVSSACWQIAP